MSILTSVCNYGLRVKVRDDVMVDIDCIAMCGLIIGLSRLLLPALNG